MIEKNKKLMTEMNSIKAKNEQLENDIKNKDDKNKTLEDKNQDLENQINSIKGENLKIKNDLENEIAYKKKKKKK